jgi:excisionase family DNA binding protein
MSTFAQWIRAELKALDRLESHPELDQSAFDDIAITIREAGRRAAAAGLPQAVEACRIRRGPVGTDLARQILAECLAAMSSEAVSLTPPQVATQLGVAPETVIGWIRAGELKAANVGKGKKRPRYRIEPEALAEFQRKKMPEVTPTQPANRRRKSFGNLVVRRFSGGPSAKRGRGS